MLIFVNRHNANLMNFMQESNNLINKHILIKLLNDIN